MQQVSPAQFSEWISQATAQGLPLILDVRETWECQLASIAPPGCEVQIMPMQDKQRPIACLCHHGGRSMQVAAFLEHHGFENITNISGGINAWSSQVDASIPVY
ncbi:MAG: putative adenylyltransferase/sulfurtransferase MoeZ [Pseudomonadota bacterium]